jgi:hypothetical protein
MARDEASNERLSTLLTQLIERTRSEEIHWERQVGSAHRYARWKNNLLILGPAAPLDEPVPRYLFITPFDSPTCVEVNSSDEQLGDLVMQLVKQVEESSRHEPPTDPFAITDAILSKLS